MITFTKQQLYSRAKIRPTGYVEDVLSKATLEGDLVCIENNVWQQLRSKYVKTFIPLPVTSPICLKRFNICKDCQAIRGEMCGITERPIKSGIPCPINKF